MNDFLTFRKMLTPIIIQVIFWVGVIVAVMNGLGAMSDGFAARGLTILIVGPIVWRILCELVILLFRMNETLTDIRHGVEKT